MNRLSGLYTNGYDTTTRGRLGQTIKYIQETMKSYRRSVREFRSSVDYVLQSSRERLCILQHLLDLVEAFVLLPEVIRVLVFGEIGGSHLIALEGSQANVLDLPLNLLALLLFVTPSPQNPLDNRPHDPPHKEELVAGQKSDEGGPLQNRLSVWDLSVVTRIEHVDQSGVHESGDPREVLEALEPWADRVRPDGDGPAKVFRDFECVGAEFDVVVNQSHDFEEKRRMSGNRLRELLEI